MEILYMDEDILVCVKPARILSTDEAGGLPDLLREALKDPKADIRTVHRLDRVVSGVMVLARNPFSASELSRQVRENEFQKEYLAVVHGCPQEKSGTMQDLLYRDKARKMTMVSETPGKGVQEAILDYEVLSAVHEMALVRVLLRTGRTHQIRVQFSSRAMPLVGERKYAERNDPCEIALWSHRIGFAHPRTGEWMQISKEPPETSPWILFLQPMKI